MSSVPAILASADAPHALVLFLRDPVVLVTLAASLLALALRLYVRWLRNAPGGGLRCASCGYDAGGPGARCAECGGTRKITALRLAHRRRWRRAIILAGVALLGVGAWWAAPRWREFAPDWILVAVSLDDRETYSEILARARERRLSLAAQRTAARRLLNGYSMSGPADREFVLLAELRAPEVRLATLQALLAAAPASLHAEIVHRFRPRGPDHGYLDAFREWAVERVVAGAPVLDEAGAQALWVLEAALSDEDRRRIEHAFGCDRLLRDETIYEGDEWLTPWRVLLLCDRHGDRVVEVYTHLREQEGCEKAAEAVTVVTFSFRPAFDRLRRVVLSPCEVCGAGMWRCEAAEAWETVWPMRWCGNDTRYDVRPKFPR